jgi:mediator of RNA polymerase II transcription subunit 12
MWTLRALISHHGLDHFPSIARSLFDLAALLSDNISDDVRKQLSHQDAVKPVDDDRCSFIFGRAPPPDGWLTLAKPVNAVSNGQMGSSPQTQSQPLNASPSQYSGQSQQMTPGPGGLQRSVSQQNVPQSVQSPGQTRTFSQYSQPSKMLPQQLQRMASTAQGGPSTQLHQMQQVQQVQQMQNMAQQRSTQPSLGHQQRMSVTPNQSIAVGKAAGKKQDKVEMKHVPFALNRWEILPECGSNALGNETAISLSLFGARKV